MLCPSFPSLIQIYHNLYLFANYLWEMRVPLVDGHLFEQEVVPLWSEVQAGGKFEICWVDLGALDSLLIVNVVQEWRTPNMGQVLEHLQRYAIQWWTIRSSYSFLGILSSFEWVPRFPIHHDFRSWQGYDSSHYSIYSISLWSSTLIVICCFGCSSDIGSSHFCFIRWIAPQCYSSAVFLSGSRAESLWNWRRADWAFQAFSILKLSTIKISDKSSIFFASSPIECEPKEAG